MRGLGASQEKCALLDRPIWGRCVKRRGLSSSITRALLIGIRWRERLDAFHKLLLGIILDGGMGRPWGSGAIARAGCY